MDANVLEVFNIYPQKGVLRGNEEFKLTVSFTPKVKLLQSVMFCHVIICYVVLCYYMLIK